MIRFDCYWMEKIREHGCTMHICTRHDEPKYNLECEECDDYISGCTVHKMVRSWADIMKNDCGISLKEISWDE